MTLTEAPAVRSAEPMAAHRAGAVLEGEPEAGEYQERAASGERLAEQAESQAAPAARLAGPLAQESRVQPAQAEDTGEQVDSRVPGGCPGQREAR